MKSFFCNHCRKTFTEWDAHHRPARLEDSADPWTNVTTCPYCGSDEIEEAEICPLCRKPHKKTLTGYCDPCTNYTKAALWGAAWYLGDGDDPEADLQDLVMKIYGI